MVFNNMSKTKDIWKQWKLLISFESLGENWLRKTFQDASYVESQTIGRLMHINEGYISKSYSIYAEIDLLLYYPKVGNYSQRVYYIKLYTIVFLNTYKYIQNWNLIHFSPKKTQKN